MNKAALETKTAPTTKGAPNHVRLDPFCIRVHAGPLRFCGSVRWNDKAAVPREPDAD